MYVYFVEDTDAEKCHFHFFSGMNLDTRKQ